MDEWNCFCFKDICFSCSVMNCNGVQRPKMRDNEKYQFHCTGSRQIMEGPGYVASALVH